VTAVKRPLFEKAAAAPRLAPEVKGRLWRRNFAECTVRAGAETEAHVARRTGAAMSRTMKTGTFWLKPLFGALPKSKTQSRR